MFFANLIANPHPLGHERDWKYLGHIVLTALSNLSSDSLSSEYILKKHGDNIQLWCSTLPILNPFVSPQLIFTTGPDLDTVSWLNQLDVKHSTSRGKHWNKCKTIPRLCGVILDSKLTLSEAISFLCYCGTCLLIYYHKKCCFSHGC